MDVGGEWQGSSLTCFLLPSSSSDAESDCGGSEASRAEPCDERPWQLEHPPLPKPLTQHSSLKEALTRAVSPHHPEEPGAVHSEQRASGPETGLLNPGTWEGSREPHSQLFLMEGQVTVGLVLRLRGSGARTVGDWGTS